MGGGGSGGEDWRFSRFSRSNPLGGKKVFGLADGESVWLVLIDRTCGGAAHLEHSLLPPLVTLVRSRAAYWNY